jgi:hypothetical protein
MLCMTWLVGATFSGSRLSAGATDLVRRTPTSWLITDAGGADVRKRDAALAELARRVAKGELTPAWVQALVGKALEEQADWQRPWAAGWGDVVEAARTAGQLSDAQWIRYQVQSLSFSLEPEKETLRPVDPLVLNLFRGPDRLSSRRPSFPLAVEPEGQISVAGRTVAYAKGGTEPVVLVAGDSAGPGRRFASVAPIDLRRQSALGNLAGGSQRVTIGLVVRPVRAEWGDGQDADQIVALPQGRRVEVGGRFVLRDELPLDELVSHEWKGVWAPPAQREILIRAEAKRKAPQGQGSAP